MSAMAWWGIGLMAPFALIMLAGMVEFAIKNPKKFRQELEFGLIIASMAAGAVGAVLFIIAMTRHW